MIPVVYYVSYVLSFCVLGGLSQQGWSHASSERRQRSASAMSERSSERRALALHLLALNPGVAFNPSHPRVRFDGSHATSQNRFAHAVTSRQMDAPSEVSGVRHALAQMSTSSDSFVGFLEKFFSPRQPEAATKLRDALVAGDGDGSTLEPLVNACAAACVPFRGELLGDGALWRAVSIVRGEVPRWERSAKLLPFLSNRAGQAYTLDDSGSSGMVINYGEVLNRGLYFKAEGSFQAMSEESQSNCCPKDFSVDIRQGGFVLGGKEFLSSAISGPGFLRLLYLDGDIRILENLKRSPDGWEEAGLVVVQVRDALFSDPVQGKL